MLKDFKRHSILLVLFLSSGCAMKTQKVNLAADTPPQVMVCYDALQKTIGVTPVSDNRPAIEKTGDKPHGIYLLLWNQRIGNYISGDKDFNDSLNAILPDQIGRAISRTNCFYQTKILEAKVPPQPTAEDLLVILGKEKVQYVLTAQVKHLYGQQRQKAYFYAIPAYFVDFFGWGNQVGPSEGHTEILFVLYDTQTGNEVLREMVTADSDSVA